MEKNENEQGFIPFEQNEGANTPLNQYVKRRRNFNNLDEIPTEMSYMQGAEDSNGMLLNDRVDTFQPNALRSENLLETKLHPQWVKKTRRYDSNIFKMFNQEIDDYMAYISPRDFEIGARKYTIDRTSALVKKLWPDAQINCFGSYETRLYLPSADIDFVVWNTNSTVDELLMELKGAILANKLSNESDISTVISARVPLLKYIDSETGYHVDISFNSDSGPIAVEYMNKQLSDKNIGTALRILVIIVKQFLFQRRLEKVYAGGLGGYSVFLMSLSFLRLHPKIQAGIIDPSKNLGTLLLEFFELYGFILNTHHVALSFKKNGSVSYTQKKHLILEKPPKPFGICIVDPMNSTNDIGGGTYAWGLIRREFSRTHRLLTTVIGKLYENHCRNILDPDRAFRCLKKDDVVEIPSTILGMVICLQDSQFLQRNRARTLWSNLNFNNQPSQTPIALNNTRTKNDLKQAYKKRIRGKNSED